jgi:hypothetical protein
MSDLRKERVGITHVARMLNVSVTEIKEALHQGLPLRGHPLPKPIARGQGSTGTQVSFYLGDIMDLAQAMKGR